MPGIEHPANVQLALSGQKSGYEGGGEGREIRTLFLSCSSSTFEHQETKTSTSIFAFVTIGLFLSI